MKANELLRAGRLSSALTELTQEVKRHPAEVKLRTFLFELLCFSGEYDRAQAQLEVISHQQESAEVGVEVYRNLLHAEMNRRRLFSDGLRPTFLSEPPKYVHLHLDALNRVRDNCSSEAKQLLVRARGMWPSVKGELDGRPFSSIRDTDDFVAPVLEVLSKGAYLWLPFEYVQKITIAAPKFLRDLMWVPATVETREGSTGEVFIPALYPGSDQDENEDIRLGRITDWRTPGEGLVRGLGQRTFLIEDEERAVLEIRELQLHV